MLDLITLISAVGLQQELKEAPKEAIIKEDTAGWAIWGGLLFIARTQQAFGFRASPVNHARSPT